MAALLIICLCVVAVSAVYINQVMLTPQVVPPSLQPREGFVAITVNIVEPSTNAAVTPTTPTFTIWHMANPGVFPINSKTDLISAANMAWATSVAAATTMSIGPGDNQHVGAGYKQYLVLAIYPGTTNYLQMAKMISGNQGLIVNSQVNIDLGSDGYPDPIFLVDITGQTLSPTQAVVTPLPLRAFVTLSDNTLSNNTPGNTDVAGAGAQSGSGVQNWQITVTTDNTGDSFVIGRVYLTFNDTQAYLTPKALTITAFDGTQTIINSPTSENIGTTSYMYYYPPSGNYRWTYNGLMMYRSTGSNTYVNIAWAYDYSFAGAGAGYGTNVFLYWDVIGPASNGGVITAYNDDVIINNWT